jgi:predicted nucleic acid-binding protein
VSGFLLDTNVVSELVRPRPHPGVVRWIATTNESLLHLSVLTLGEIRKGIASRPDAGRRAKLESWLHDLVLRFSSRILPIDLAIADRWGRLSGHSKTEGVTLPVIDGLLAATALHNNLVLVTRNVTDIGITGVETFDPWSL